MEVFLSAFDVILLPFLNSEDEIAGINKSLKKIEKEIVLNTKKIVEAEKNVLHPQTGTTAEYWIDKERQLRDEKRQLRDKERQLRDEKIKLLDIKQYVKTVPALGKFNFITI